MDRIRKTFKYVKLLNTSGFWVGFIAGLFYFSYIFWWLWSLYPLDSLGIEKKSVAIIILSVIFTLCVFITSTFWGLFGFFAEKFSKNNLGLTWTPLLLASAFVIAEYLRSIFFSIFWYGGGGAIGPHWPLGNIAYLFVDINYISRLSSFFGIYSIDFILFYGGSLIFLFFSNLTKWKTCLIQAISLLGLILLLNLIYSHQDVNLDTPISVAVVQTNIGSLDLLDTEKSISIFQKKLELISSASKTAELIILPEGAGLLSNLSRFLKNDGIKKYFDKLSDKEIFILDNMRTSVDDQPYSVSTLISSKSGLVGLYNKEILVPLGEFMPYIAQLPISLLSSDYMGWFSTYRVLAKGSGQNIIQLKNVTLKVLICSELISPGKSLSGNPNLIITLGSYSVWNSDRLAKKQILSAARFRAIENRKYLVLASNSDQSYIINDRGIIEKSGTPNTFELLTGSVVPNHNRTWYNYVGDWPILLLSSVFFGLALRKIRNGTKS